jgi:acyl-CoA synthetase (AMP-forming)/AMP-acid ligase II
MAEVATLNGLLERLVSRCVTGPWIADHTTELDVSGFLARVRRLALELARCGVAPGDRVAAYLEHGIDLAAVPFACARLGALSVLVNPKSKDAQVRHVVTDSGSKVVLTSATKAAALNDERAAFDSARIVHVEVLGNDAEDGPEPVAVAPEQPATILYTSGSTGRPKGIVQSHRSLWDGARIVADYLGMRPRDHVLAVLPLSFDYGLNQVLSSAWVGCRVTLHGYFAAPELLRTLIATRATGLAGVPELWVDFVDVCQRHLDELSKRHHDGLSGLGALSYVTNSGGRLPLRVIEWFHEHLPHVAVFSMYGLTEAFRSSYVAPEWLATRPRSIGRAIPEVELLVVDPDTGVVRRPGEVGELVHAGALVADGYWNRPEDTARRFRPHPVRGTAGGMAVWSGDLAWMDEDGYLELVGRADAQFKVGGFRVSPDEVVEVVSEVDGVRTAAAVGVPRGPDGLPALVIAVVPAAGADRDALPERVRAACRGNLPSYLAGAEVHVIDALPLGPNHKVDHAALRARFASIGENS